ncbi:MAG: hypothetical protein CSA36_05890 [Draconibacterium sp.]|nr:MAG: hypothetical protein CSA36_05890 [Draconibacterium sp.]
MIQFIRQFHSEITHSELLLLLVFLILFVIRFLYLFLFTGRVLFSKKKKLNDKNVSPVTIIMTVRNEEDALKKQLPSLLTIENVDYEMIVVDDFSQDNTYLVLGALKEQFWRLKISALNEETRFSAKLSQNIALKAATNDWVITVSVEILTPLPDWLPVFVSQFYENISVVTGYENLEDTGGFYNRLYRTACFLRYLKTCGYILNGLAVVYSDENVAFRKSNYFRLGGYGAKIKEPYANLELMINRFICKKQTAILFSEESSLRKERPVGLHDFLDQLKKNYRIEQHLTAKKRLFIAFDDTTKILFLVFSLLTIIILPKLWPVFTLLLGGKFIAHAVILKSTQNRLNERKIFLSSLMYDVLIPFLTLFHRWYFNYRSRKQKWRGIA